MKSIVIFCFMAILPFMALQAQNSTKFSGTIVYKITYPNAANNPMASQLPTTLEMKFSGNKAYTEMVLPYGKNSFIINGDEPSILRLVNMEKGNYFIKKTKDDFKSLPSAMVAKTKETKTVAGIKCSTAELNSPGGQSGKRKIYFSEELGDNNIFFNTDFRTLKGIPLEFEYNLMGMPVQLTATAVKPGRVSAKEFEMPKGYTETTEAKLREMRGPVIKK